jgi:hypothetical protein
MSASYETGACEGDPDIGALEEDSAEKDGLATAWGSVVCVEGVVGFEDSCNARSISSSSTRISRSSAKSSILRFIENQSTRRMNVVVNSRFDSPDHVTIQGILL